MLVTQHVVSTLTPIVFCSTFSTANDLQHSAVAGLVRLLLYAVCSSSNTFLHTLLKETSQFEPVIRTFSPVTHASHGWLKKQSGAAVACLAHKP